MSKRKTKPKSVEELPEWEIKLRAMRNQGIGLPPTDRTSVASAVAKLGLAEAEENPGVSDVIKLRAAVAMAHVLNGRMG